MFALPERRKQKQDQVFTLNQKSVEPHAMARPLRIHSPHAVYHVTTRGNERKPIGRNYEVNS
jgi:hypothetical protein